jgi:hypothetical protein
MADPASPSGATPEAGATPAGVAEAVPAPDTTDDELGEGGKAALATLRKELRTIKAERDELATAKRTAEDAERSELEKATASRDEATGRVSEPGTPATGNAGFNAAIRSKARR